MSQCGDGCNCESLQRALGSSMQRNAGERRQWSGLLNDLRGQLAHLETMARDVLAVCAVAEMEGEDVKVADIYRVLAKIYRSDKSS